jgi:FlaA1/EpsC-like NDP-sugar epimerase
MDGNPHPGQFTKINVDDLLNRAPIQLDQSLVNDSVREKIVLVTGCAGSIGSEIVRQLLRYEPALVIGIDQAESPLAALSLELKKHVDVGTFVPIIGNVCDLVKMERLMKTFRPEYVFHAAAYKHVPIMEVFPEEAIKTNVQGTRNMADLSVQFDVSKFVMISTDKVIKPSNVMGASKRIAEMYVQSLNFASHSKTHFITTRFGNVLGSNGSVIPIFNSQINALLPITITHPEVSRYFMTIPEACQLVLEAGSFGNGGEIFIFDMGEPVYILELAKRMIQMAGLTPYVDIPILITGLRPGEKLTEELLADSENTIPTHHPKIKKASVRLVSYQEVLPIIDRLIAAANEQQTASDIVTLMKELVPEFESQNSVFEYLDKRKDHYYSTA